MFERFTDKARRVVVQAQVEARTLRNDYIGTEHLLLGLLHQEEDGLALHVLRARGIDPQALAQEVTEQIDLGEDPLAEGRHIPFTPRAKKTLEFALREALQLQHNYIGTEHLLLGILHEQEGLAPQVLISHGLDLETARHQVIKLLGARLAGRSVRLAEGLAPPGQAITLSDVSFQLRSISRRLSSIEAKLDIEKSPTQERLNALDLEIAVVRRDKAAAIDEKDFEAAARHREQEKKLMAALGETQLAWLREEAGVETGDQD
jgi:ATP-dependent Clp protease ATP-binding subunit ClpC